MAHSQNRDVQNRDIPSLNARFQALEEERRQNWTREGLAVNATQRHSLRQEHAATRYAAAGDRLEPATLLDVDGNEVSLDSFTNGSRAVLIFFRFANCPACNIALPYYRDTLWPILNAAGIRFAAVSPQPYPALGEIVERHALPFPVLSDPGLALARRLGITYVYDDASRQAAEAKGGTSQALNGMDVWELPKPAALILGVDRRVEFIDITPDWMERTETVTILAALDAVSGERFLAA